MKRISLTQGQFALVDDEDYEELSRHKWYAAKTKYGGYVAKRRGHSPKDTMIYMHRQILGLKPGDKRQGDHRDHNTLDYRRSNLRICTNRQNQQNGLSRKGSSSRYKGVSWYKRYKKWMARIQANGKHIFLGYFDSEIEAALAYNRMAVLLFGEFAYLNKIS